MVPKTMLPSITLVAILGIFSTIVGCALANPPAASSEIELTAMGALPVSTPAKATLEPSPMTIVPTVEPLATEIPLSDVSSPIVESISLLNPGFEDQETAGIPVGWSNNGAAEASYIEDRGHSGDLRLTHQGSGAYQVETWQTITGLENEWHTLRAWVRSSGGQNAVYVSLKCGSEEKRAYVPSTTPGYRWIQLSISNLVTDGQCTISLYSDANPDTWASFDDIELTPGRAVLSILGADISSLKKSEDMGGVYRDADGAQRDALQILKAHGLNYARLRVWVEPADGYHGKEEVLEMALRLKALGIGPARRAAQPAPACWRWSPRS